MAICQEFFSFKIYDLSKLKFYPSRVLDVGAYKGYFSFLSFNSFPNAEFYAFEPHPNNFLAMERNFHENGMFDIVLIQNLISDSNLGIVTFYFNESNGSIDPTIDEFVESMNLKTVSIDNYLNVDKLLLKFDIEGSERTIFPDIISKLPHTCAIFLEIHHDKNLLIQLESIFLNNGFSYEILRSREFFTEILVQRV